MKDSLKDFINQHREEFDDKQPSDSSWSKIERNIPNRRVALWNNVHVWRAAAVLFLSMSVYLLVSKSFNQSSISDRAQLQVEFSDLENFYNGQIADKVELISTIQEFNDDESFAQDLEKLDAMYQVLREQMKAHPSEKIKDALILNMLVRIDLLNQQIKNLEDSGKKSEEVTI
jgi:ABC-type multidrug transport system fused ATPase/permease subunit